MSSRVSNNELDLATQPLDHGLVVQANAGTGKTYSITALIAREVSKPPTPPASACEIEDFLIVTFTNNAASDLRVRVREQLSSLRAALLHPAKTTPESFVDIHRANLGGNVDAARLAIEKALGSLDRASISTIHQFCGSVLRLAGLPLSEVVEERVITSVIRSVASDIVVNRSEAGQQGGQPVVMEKLSEFLEELLSNPDVDLDGLTTANDPKLTKDLIQLVHEAREEVRKRLENSLTHDETIRRALTLLEQSEKGDGLLLQQVRGMYRYCIIDESQDTDKDQWRLFKLLFPDGVDDGRALMVVGDPKQSIYAFRGADVGAYLEETNQRPPALIKDLTTNYRSDVKLIDALNLLLDGSEYGDIPNGPVIGYRAAKSNNPKSEILHAGQPAEPVELIAVETTSQPALVPATVKQVTSLLSGNYAINEPLKDADGRVVGMRQRNVSEKDIAILVKSGPLGRKIQAALLAKSIPAVSNSTESVAEGETFSALSELAKAFERPSDDGLARRVAMSVLFAVPGRDERLLSETHLVKIQQTLEDWRDAMSTKGIGALALLVLADVDVRKGFLATRDGERHLTDFNQIVEFVEDATDGQPISPRRLRELLAEIEKTDHRSNDLAARRVESDDDAVQISTIHSTKGLQYPIVIVVDMWSTWTAQGKAGPRVVRRGNSGLPGSGRVMDVGYIVGKTITTKSPAPASSAYQQLKKDGDAELKRLFYVGVTRAQHHLTVIYPTKATLALRTNLDNKSKKSDVVGCFDLPSPVGGSIYPALPASLVGLVHLGGRGHAIPMAAPPSRTSLRTNAAHREVGRTRDRTSFSQIKKQLEKPNIETSHAFAAEDFVRTDDEFEVAIAREEGDMETKAPPTMPLWDVPKGKDFGTALHYVFEHLDPMASDLSAEVGRVVDAHVGPAMLEGHREQLIAGLLQVLETPFGALWNDVQLRQIPKTSRLEEVRFDAMLPEGDELSVPNTKAIGDYIASVVAANDPLSEYALLLSGSEKGIPLRGTLNGSIDALLHLSSEPHKFVISDYKSNWLRDPNDEPALERYSPENLWTAMTVNHYPLQALIYGAAAYRYLRSRGMSISQADGSILGFAYLFVRGMIGGANTPLQKSSRLNVFVGQRYGVSSWSSAPYPTFWSGLSDVLLGVR